MATNRRLVDISGSDFYVTPYWGTEALLLHEKFYGTILEPCCGDGAIVKVLRNHGCDYVFASDLHDHGFGHQLDFFEVRSKYDNVITNPPFNIDEKVFHHAWGVAQHKIALLLRTAFLEGQKRYETLFSIHPPTKVLVFSERLSMYPKGHPQKNGGTTCYSWFIWDKLAPKKPPQIEWIKPGLKEKVVSYEEILGK